jgi:hemerythrin-like domain-containing protein
MSDTNSSATRADTRVLQAVHKTFRLATDRLVDATERLEPSALQPIIGTRWAFYTAVLNHHHHNEDDKAFPALVAVRPDMKDMVEALEEDHRRLVMRMNDVNDAVATFEANPDIANRDAMHDAIVGVRDEFFPHLDTEDAKVIPAFGESIPPAEWEKMDNEALKTIPRAWLPTAVGALDEVIRGLPEAERPMPPPLPIRVMLALSWRRKWAAWIKPMLPGGSSA